MGRYIDKALQDVHNANKNNSPLAALALALTLPDICSQAEHGKKYGTRKDYVDWCNKWMPVKEKWCINGNEYYALRCAILHNGNDDVYEQNILKDETDLLFQLSVSNDTQKPSINLFIKDADSGPKIIQVNTLNICHRIVSACTDFLKQNPEIKFNCHLNII